MSAITSTRLRWCLWLALLAATAWLVISGDAASESQALPVRVTTAASQGGVTAPRVPDASDGTTSEQIQGAVDPLVDRQRLWNRDSSSDSADRPPRDLFSARDWRPPAPTVPAAASEETSPPPPPALPFVYLGGKLEGGTWEVFLARGEHTFVVKEGQVIEGVYRVERVAPPTMTFTHLPSGQEQHLAIGSGR